LLFIVKIEYKKYISCKLSICKKMVKKTIFGARAGI
jgi:hypothetical protein